MKLVLLSILFTVQLHAQSWTQLSDFPGTERDDGAAFVIQEKAYCLSGLDLGFSCTSNGFIFDSGSESWSAMASMPVGNERQYATAFSYNSYGYILGGINCSNVCLNDFWRYDPLMDAWLNLPAFPGTARQGMSHFIIKDKVYVTGGKLTNGTILNDVWEYNFTTSLWTQKNNMPVTGMWRGAAFAIDTTGYICFGMHSNQAFNHSLYKYTHTTDSWQKITNLSLPAKRYVGTAVCNNKGCLYGGQDSLGNITNELLVFNPLDSTVTTTAGLPTFGRKGGMAFSIHNTFYYTTGVSATARVKETWKNITPVGINEPEAMTAIHLFPNPATETIALVIPGFRSEGSLIEISNLLGENKYLSEFNNTVDISMLEDGIYIIIIKNKDSHYKTKFVKQH